MGIHYSVIREKTPQLLCTLGLVALSSCGSAIESTSQSMDVESAELQQSVALTKAGAEQDLAPTAAAPQRRPQLIKRAFLQIEIDAIDDAIASIETLLAQYQGDLLQLSDQDTQSDSPRQVQAPRQVQIELRIPQENLSAALEQFRELGTVQEQSITAEDVSDQLVDLQARVRNLRKSEDALLEIMERSGSIADVLEVARELSTVRETIERADAQVKNLQNRVVYSTVSLTLISTGTPSPTPSPIGETLGLTWQSASSAMRTVSVALLQLLLWLMVFSPYLAILVLSGWLGRRYWHQHHRVEE